MSKVVELANRIEVRTGGDSPGRPQPGPDPGTHWRHLLLVIAFALVYWVTGNLGLRLATVGRSVTFVWPNTGIALAGLLLFGHRLWPGVALGALAVNALTPGVPLLSALGVATGNTLEALFGVYLLRRFSFRDSLERVRDVLMLALGAGGFSSAVSASFGVVSLWIGGVVPIAGIPNTWKVWWLGDLMGDLIVAPVFLALVASFRNQKPPGRPAEALLVGVSVVATSLLAFGQLRLPLEGLAHGYLVFPALIWAGLRYRVAGAAVANLIISGIAVWATVHGRGPFAGPTLEESLFLCQTFMAVVALTGLVLGAAAAERSRAIRLRDEFLSMASHELRTPLTPLKLQIHMLRRVIERAVADGALPDDFNKKFLMMDKQVDRMVGLVDELLDVSRVGAGRLTLKIEEVDLGALVQDTVEAFTEQLPSLRVEVLVQEPIRGQWDRLRVQQVVTNLLTNAAKYGGGEPITLALSSSGAAATLAVIDRGIGISKEQQNVIFEPFERGSAAPKVGGLGLGLYIVRKIVEAHQGTVRVVSQPGLGSTFTVELPTRPPTAAPS